MNMVGLPPGMIITSSGETFALKRLCEVGGDRLAQLRNAVRRRVAVMAVADRLDGGFGDVLGRLEVGLADAEVDDVAALGGKRVRARQHREGVLLADAVEVRRRSSAWRFLSSLSSFPSPRVGEGGREQSERPGEGALKLPLSRLAASSGSAPSPARGEGKRSVRHRLGQIRGAIQRIPAPKSIVSSRPSRRAARSAPRPCASPRR